MAQITTTTDLEPLDLVCWRHYGATSGVVELVLESNPHICDVAYALPLGTVLSMPEPLNRQGARPALWS